LPAARRLKGKEVRHLVREFTQRYPTSSSILHVANDFEELIVDDSSVVFVDGRPLVVRTQGLLLPSLRFDELLNTLAKVIVDMGAVAHVANGAQIMRPGIKQIKDSFSKANVVVIVDEKFGKAIALGIADVDSSVMQSTSKGKVISNVHFVGDVLWKTYVGPKLH
jgi:PUA-domain protein